MKTSLKNDLARIQFRLTQELTSFREQHAAGEQNRLRIARGNTLNRISKIIRQVAAMGDPWQILAVESHCEQFYLDFFAKTTQAIQASIQSLRTISRLRDTLTAPFDPERYKNNLRKSIGAQNMDKLPPVPRDDFHLFVRSQVQRLTKAPGQLATPPEAEYFYARKEALQTALKFTRRTASKPWVHIPCSERIGPGTIGQAHRCTHNPRHQAGFLCQKKGYIMLGVPAADAGIRLLPAVQ